MTNQRRPMLTIFPVSVRSFGTEDRPTDRPVAPRDEVYEYIIFRGSDIKDIRVCQPPKPQPTLQGGLPNDPAIVQVVKQISPAGFLACKFVRFSAFRQRRWPRRPRRPSRRPRVRSQPVRRQRRRPQPVRLRPHRLQLQPGRPRAQLHLLRLLCARRRALLGGPRGAHRRIR